MQFSTLEEISAEWHITPSAARNRLALGQDTPSIKVGRRWLFPLTEFEKWVASVIAPIQEAPRKDAVLFFLIIRAIGLACRAKSARKTVGLEHRRHELGLAATGQVDHEIRAHRPGGRP